MEKITLKTKCGDIIGAAADHAVFFRNVPFATAGRFEPAVQVDRFPSVIDAGGPSIECPQYSSFLDESEGFYAKEFRKGQTFRYCEETLYLSVIAPQNRTNCPVLVHIYGGGFLTGKHGEHPAADSLEYVRRGIILVSISYRLNVFSLYRGKNLHIGDQLCALKWIKENIADYGGDADNVTLIGESAGGMSIFDLLFCEEFTGLARRAVIMSGIMLLPRFLSGYTPEKSKAFWDDIMHKLGADRDEDLQKSDPKELWSVWHEETRRRRDRLRLNQPAIDGRYITDSASGMLKGRKMADIPLIIGVAAQDMYFPALMFAFAKRFANRWCRHQKENLYFYYFDHVLPGGRYRAFHSADLWYTFGNMAYGWRPFGEEDHQLKDAMIDCVSRFALEGDPGWAAYQDNDKKIRRFHSAREEYLKGCKHYGELLLNSLFRRGPM